MGLFSGSSPYLGLIKFNVNSIPTGVGMELNQPKTGLNCFRTAAQNC